MNVTSDLIIQTLKGWVETKTPIAPQTYLDAALKLNILIQGEMDKITELEQKCAEIEIRTIEQGKSSVEAKTRLKTHTEWMDYKKQEGKVKQIQEYIRIAKKYANIINDQLNSGL